jgi:pectinesterase
MSVMSRAMLVAALASLMSLAAGVQDAKIRIVLVGDSTVAEGGGWGPGLRAAFGAGVEVMNLARNGRSSKSFRDEGAWGPALEAKADYVVIQFGHNDCPGKGPERETDPKTTYRENMARYVDEARASGAQAVLATSIVRRNFTEEGKIRADCLVPFVEELRSLAAEKKAPLLDLYSLTLEQAESLGPAASDELGPVGADGKPDRTHLAPKGQVAVGAIAAAELVRVEPRLKPMLKVVE